MQLNIELLQQVRTRIEINSSKFDWMYWFHGDNFVASEQTTNHEPCKILEESCGTTMCIAGWAISLACPAGMKVNSFVKLNGSTEQSAAAKILFGLSFRNDFAEYERYSDFLFLPWSHEDLHSRKLASAHNSREQMRDEALRRIDWLLEGKDISLYEMPKSIVAQGEECHNPDCPDGHEEPVFVED